MLKILLISRRGNGAVDVAERWSVQDQAAVARLAATPAETSAASATARVKHTTRYWRPVIAQVKSYRPLISRLKQGKLLL